MFYFIFAQGSSRRLISADSVSSLRPCPHAVTLLQTTEENGDEEVYKLRRRRQQQQQKEDGERKGKLQDQSQSIGVDKQRGETPVASHSRLQIK